MKLAFKILFLLTGLLAYSCDTGINEPAEELTGVSVMEVNLDHEEILVLRTHRLLNTYVPADIYFKGEEKPGRIRSSGSGSRYHPKQGYKIELADNSTFPLKDIRVSEFNLSSQVFDRTLFKTALASHLYRQLGFLVSKNDHVFLRFNSKNEGLYPMIERVDRAFFERRGLPVYESYKLSFEAKFTFTEMNHTSENFDREIPDDDNYYTLNEFIYAVDTSDVHNLYATLGKYLDIDNYISYHAMTSVLNNYDAFSNNFILYKLRPKDPFSVIPWDYDKSFTRENNVGLQGDNEIIKKLFKNEGIKGTYYARVFYIIENIFTEQNLYPLIDSLAAEINEAYNLDPYLGGEGRYDFYTEIVDLKNYIKERRIELLGLLHKQTE